MKRIVVDIHNRTEHHLLSGRLYYIDRRLERCGSSVYLDRSYVRHESIAGVRSILLPEHHLWVMFIEGHHPPHEIQCYMHMARIIDEGATITVEDLYLDVLVLGDGQWQLVDIDEFRGAVASGQLSQDQIDAALQGLENGVRLVQDHGSRIEAHLHAVTAWKA